MPICISCRYPVKSLYTSYSKADDRALGKGVRLTQCPRCKRFADKYVEHDFVVLFIDLVLIKPQVYRHLLFNRLGRDDDKFDRSIIRLGILLLLFDVYLTWARIEKLSPLPSPSSQLPPFSSTPPNTTTHNAPPSEPTTNAALLQTQPLILQYLFFLLLVTTSTLSFHLPIRLLCTLNSPSPPPPPPITTTTHDTRPTNPLTKIWKSLVPHYPHPNLLSTALLISSCSKLFPILLIIWDYDLPSAATAVSWAVIVNNIAALEILMDCGYVSAAVLVAVGAAVRAVVAGLVLRAVGLANGWENHAWSFGAAFVDVWREIEGLVLVRG